MNNIPQINDYNGKLRVKDGLFTPQTGVTLDGGLFAQVFRNNFTFLTHLEDDRMTYWFDKKAGREPKAERYSGHFEDNLKGSTLSMFLMGACNLLRWADDPILRARVDKLAAVLAESQEADGFLMPVDKRDFAWREYPHYVRIWLTYALHAYGTTHGGDYSLLRSWQDWFNSCEDLPIIKYLELAFQGVVASPYVYMTPAGKYDDIQTTIDYYEEDWRLAQFMRREPDCVSVRKQPGREPHAHGTELESFEGYLDLYRATGRNYYLSAVLGAWELYHRDWEHPGGGIVMCEGMSKNYPKCYWLSPENNYNELCCTAFWLFLNQRLHRLFPDEEKYVAEIEKSLYNIAIANQDGGDGIRYFAYLEGSKQASGLVHCCCGVGTRIFGCLPEFVFSLAPGRLSVDLYTDATIEDSANGLKAVLRGDAAGSDEATLTLDLEGEKELELRLRIPCWSSADVPVELNGETIGVYPAGTYAVIRRTFRGGDVLKLTFSRAFRLTAYEGAEQIDGGKLKRYYIERGPLLYAVTGGDLTRCTHVGWGREDFESWLTPDGDGWTIASHPGMKLEPYYRLPAGQTFTCCPVML